MTIPFPTSLLTYYTERHEAIVIRPERMPPPGALISCLVMGLWFLAYYYPLENDLIRLVDELGNVRLLPSAAITIEGVVVSRQHATRSRPLSTFPEPVKYRR